MSMNKLVIHLILRKPLFSSLRRNYVSYTHVEGANSTQPFHEMLLFLQLPVEKTPAAPTCLKLFSRFTPD